MEIVVDEERVDLIIGTLLEQMEENGWPYNRESVITTQDEQNMPSELPRGGIEHAIFLFINCYWMRGGIRSVVATRGETELYRRWPEFFVLEEVSTFDPMMVADELKQVINYKSKELGPFWVTNAQRMVERWGGDPRNIFDGVSDYEEACRRVMNKRGAGFMGFQEKMVSMLLYYFIDAGLIEPFKYPAPADFHLHRLALTTRMLTNTEFAYGKNVLTPEFSKALRDALENYARRHDVDPELIANCMWLFSGSMCSESPGNLTKKGEYLGRSTELSHPGPVWTPTQLKQFDRSCGSCVVSQWCNDDIASGPWYSHGLLIPERPHSTPDHLHKLYDVTAAPGRPMAKPTPKPRIPQAKPPEMLPIF